MKFKKIKTKMLVSILPVIAVVLIALTLIAAVSCLNMVNTKVQESMTATLDAETGSINQELEAVKATAMQLLFQVQLPPHIRPWCFQIIRKC